jgi:hypothetical protein
MRMGVLVLFLLILIGTARAQDLSPPNSAGNLVAEPLSLFDANPIGAAPEQNSPVPDTPARPSIIEPQHFSVASSAEADSLGNRSVYLDATFAPFSGIDDSGIRFRATGDADWYRFIINENPRTLGSGHDLQGGLMAGYNVSLSQFSVTGLVGPAFGNIINDGVTTNRWGAQAALEMQLTPSDLTAAAASVSYSTIANYLQVQAKAGLKFFEIVTVGPEAKFSWQRILPFQLTFITPTVVTTTPVLEQTSLSYMHIGAYSTVSIGSASVGVSGGWADSPQLGSGYYGSLSVYVPF